jgi:hypothetical protein
MNYRLRAPSVVEMIDHILGARPGKPSVRGGLFKKIAGE